jgi:hypothetical protein
MLITPEAFDAIVAAIKSRAKAADASDRRKAPREATVGQAIIIPCGPRPKRVAAIVEVHDISPDGLGFVHSESLKVGEEFILYLSSASEPKAILCTVMRWNPRGDRLFAIGATFTRNLRIGASSNVGVDQRVLDDIEERLAAVSRS